MSRKLISLGVILSVVLAMSAAFASGASAVAFKFKSEKAATIITGSQHDTFSDSFVFDSGTVQCPVVSYVGEQVGMESTEFTVEPTYTGCTEMGGIKVPIDVNGCKYKFNSGDIEGGFYEGSMDFVCPAGVVMKVTALGCTITIPSQNGLKKVTYTNKGAGTAQERTVDVNLTGLTYQEHNLGMCPKGGAVKKNGTMDAKILTAGEDAFKKAVGIWVQ